MKIWLTKNSEVSVREQLITQVLMAIASGDLAVEDKLPSTNEISRRFKIHANTVSSAYQELVEKGWLKFRLGSGYYVQEIKAESSANQLDLLIVEFLQNAQKQGFTMSSIQNRLTRFWESAPPNRFLVIESDTDLREILIAEIEDTTNFKVLGISLEDFNENPYLTRTVCVAMFDEMANLKTILPPNQNCIFLKTTSVVDSLKGQVRPKTDDLIAIISGWDNFLLMAKTMLLAAKIKPENMLIRSTRFDNWENGLNQTSLIICDYLTAKNFSYKNNLRIFKLISEQSLNELLKITT